VGTDENGKPITQGNPALKAKIVNPALALSGTSPKKGFGNLPVELVTHIIRYVASGSARDMAVGLRSIMCTNQYLAKVVAQDKPLLAHYLLLKRLMPHFDDLITHLPVDEIDSPMLEVMGPKQLKRHVTSVPGLSDGPKKCILIGDFGAGTLRQELVTAALGLSDDYPKAEAIAGLGRELAVLLPSKRQELVTAAFGLSSEYDKARAIAGLVHGLAALSPSFFAVPVSALCSAG
jgi:hypothetical protein